MKINIFNILHKFKIVKLICVALTLSFIFSGLTLTTKAESIQGIKLYTRQDTKTRTMENELVFGEFVGLGDKDSRTIEHPGYIGEFEEDINYSTRVLDGFNFYYSPDYYELPGYLFLQVSNEWGNFVNFSEGVIAGGNIMAWYNGMVDGADLIPGHEPWQYGQLGYKKWNVPGPALNDAILLLGDDMKSDSGVTINNYFNGLDTYVTRRGRSLADNTNLLQQGGALGGVISQEFVNALKSGKLVTAFVDGFVGVGLEGVVNIGDGLDNFSGRVFEGLYAFAVEGFLMATYYDAQGNQIKQDVYLCIYTVDYNEYIPSRIIYRYIRATSHTVLKGLYVTQIVS